jgi:predicted PurR-regulated permease PerM
MALVLSFPVHLFARYVPHALPDLVQNLERYLIRALNALHRRELLPDAPEVVAARLTQDFRNSISVIAENVLGRTVGIVFGTFSYVLTLFAVVFVAVSLLSNVRSFKATYLTSVPNRDRGMRSIFGTRSAVFCRATWAGSVLFSRFKARCRRSRCS